MTAVSWPARWRHATSVIAKSARFPAKKRRPLLKTRPELSVAGAELTADRASARQPLHVKKDLCMQKYEWDTVEDAH